MVGRILASKIYYDNVKYPPIISETQYNLIEKRRCEKHQAYSTILQTVSPRYDDALTARIIEKITVRSRNEIEIRFIGGYKKTMQLT